MFAADSETFELMGKASTFPSLTYNYKDHINMLFIFPKNKNKNKINK